MSLASWNFSPAGLVGNNLPIPNTYYEETSGYQENFGSGNASVVRVFLVGYEQRLNFMADCLGYSLNNAGTIQRVLPDRLQELPNFYAAEGAVEAFGDPDIIQGRSTWTAARVSIVYRPVDFAIKADNEVSTGEWERYVTRTYEPQAEFISLQGGMKFVTGGQVVSNPPNKISPTLLINYLWRDVPSRADPNQFAVPNLSKIVAALGTTNNATFDGYPAGTLLCLPPEARMVLPRLGNNLDKYHWEINFKFMYKNSGGGIGGARAGVNYLYNVADGAWDLPTHNGLVGGNRIYPSSTFTDLFTLDGA